MGSDDSEQDFVFFVGSYLTVLGIVERSSTELEVPALPPLKGARLLQQVSLFHALLREQIQGKTNAHEAAGRNGQRSTSSSRDRA